MANAFSFTPTGGSALSATYLRRPTIPVADNNVVYEPITGYGMVSKDLGVANGLVYGFEFYVTCSTHALQQAAITAWMNGYNKKGALSYGFAGVAGTTTVSSVRMNAISYESISPTTAVFTTTFQTVVT